MIITKREIKIKAEKYDWVAHLSPICIGKEQKYNCYQMRVKQTFLS